MIYQSKRKIALFTALCLFCAMVELIIPKPTFIKLGISNIPVMLAIFSGFSLQEYALLVAMRIVSQGILNGTIASYSFILSLTAGISSSATMWLLAKNKKLSFISISIAGAFISNCCQVFMSSFFLGKGVFSLAPLIIGVGLITSAVMGLFCELYIKKSKFLAKLTDVTFYATLGTETFDISRNRNLTPRVLKIFFAATLLVCCFFSSNVIVTSVTGVSLLLCCIASGRKVRVIPILWLIFRTVFINILLPSGEVLFSVGVLKVTHESLLLGIRRSLILLSSNWFSNFIIPKKDEVTQAFKPGSLLYLTFDYFKTITENWYHVGHGNNTIDRVDNTLAASVLLDSEY